MADPHFGHSNILTYCSDRPWSNVEAMDKGIINNSNSIVTDDDDLIIDGDVCLKSATHHNFYMSRIRKLKGRKILIIGNHDDLRPRFYLSVGFWSVHTSLEIKIKDIDAIVVHDPCFSCMDRSKLYICGHVHDLFLTQKNVINVGLDVHNYFPVSEDYIYDLYQSKIKQELK